MDVNRCLWCCCCEVWDTLLWKKHTCLEALVAWLLVRVFCECLCVCVGDVREVAVGAEAFAIVEEVPAVHFAVASARRLGEAEQVLSRFGVVLQLLSGFLGAAVRRLAAAGRLLMEAGAGLWVVEKGRDRTPRDIVRLTASA